MIIMDRQRLGYLMSAGQAVNDAEHNHRIAVWIVSYLNCHSIQQHLVQSVGKQRLRQFTEKVFQHTCDINMLLQTDILFGVFSRKYP